MGAIALKAKENNLHVSWQDDGDLSTFALQSCLNAAVAKKPKKPSPFPFERSLQLCLLRWWTSPAPSGPHLHRTFAHRAESFSFCSKQLGIIQKEELSTPAGDVSMTRGRRGERRRLSFLSFSLFFLFFISFIFSFWAKQGRGPRQPQARAGNFTGLPHPRERHRHGSWGS